MLCIREQNRKWSNADIANCELQFCHCNDANACQSATTFYFPVIVVGVKDQTRYSAACQATGKPVPSISWYFNDVPVNMSTDKYNITGAALFL